VYGARCESRGSGSIPERDVSYTSKSNVGESFRQHRTQLCSWKMLIGAI